MNYGSDRPVTVAFQPFKRRLLTAGKVCSYGWKSLQLTHCRHSRFNPNRLQRSPILSVLFTHWQRLQFDPTVLLSSTVTYEIGTDIALSICELTIYKFGDTPMKGTKSTYLALVAVLLSPMAANADIITIDFDTLPGGGTIASGTEITNQYAPFGATFSLIEDGSEVSGAFASQIGASTSTGDNSLFNCPGACGARADILRIVFESLVSDVSWYTDSEGSLDITFNAYDAGGILLESITATSIFPDFVFTTFSVGGIARIDALQPSDSWGWSLDDLTYTTSVPEPGTLALLGIGLLGMGAARRRKKA